MGYESNELKEGLCPGIKNFVPCVSAYDCVTDRRPSYGVHHDSIQDTVLIDPIIFKKIIDVKNRQYLYEKQSVIRHSSRGYKKIYNNHSNKIKKLYEREKFWKHSGPYRNFPPQNITEKMIKKYKFMVDYCEKYNLCKFYTRTINAGGCSFECEYSIEICILNFNHDIKKKRKQFQEFIIENLDADWVKNYIDHNKLKYKKE